MMKRFFGKRRKAAPAERLESARPDQKQETDSLYGGGPKHRTLADELHLHRRHRSSSQNKKLHTDRKPTRDEKEREVVPLLFLFKWACITALALAALWVLRWHLNTINNNQKEELELALERAKTLEQRMVDQPVFDLEPARQMPFLIRHWDQSLEEANAAKSLLRWESDQEALKRLHKAIEVNPEHQESRVLLAEICMREGEYPRTVDLLIHALNTDPSEKELRLMLAEALVQMDEYAAARQVADWIVKSNPRHLDALKIAARMKMKLNDLSGALKNFEQILVLEENNREALEGVARIYFERGNFPAVIPIYNRLIQLNPEVQEYYYRLAVAQAQQESPIKTVIALELAVSHFGEGQIRGWIPDSKFDPIRENHLFRGFSQRIASEAQKRQQLAVEQQEDKEPAENAAPQELRKLEFGMQRLESELFKPGKN
jgi:tetratricopeptide (TPR) repeat protein